MHLSQSFEEPYFKVNLKTRKSERIYSFYRLKHLRMILNLSKCMSNTIKKQDVPIFIAYNFNWLEIIKFAEPVNKSEKMVYSF